MIKIYSADQTPEGKKAYKEDRKKQGVTIHEADDPNELPDPRNEVAQWAQDTAYGGAQGLTFNAADEIYGGVKSAVSDVPYEEARDSAREEWRNARERSPIGTFGGEMVGATVSPIGKVFRGAKGVKDIMLGAGEGALQSYGATDKEGVTDQVLETAGGAGMGAIVGGAANALTKTFSKSPIAVRAEVLGVKAKDYAVNGPGDVKGSIERVNSSGFLKPWKKEYNVDTLKFEKKSKSIFALDQIEKNTEDRLIENSQDALNKLSAKKEKLFGTKLDHTPVIDTDIEDLALDIADEYLKAGVSLGPRERLAKVDQIRKNIKDMLIVNSNNPSYPSLRDLNDIKRAAQGDVANFSKSLGDVGDSEELARITAHKLKKLVEDKINDPLFKDLNSAEHDFLNIEGTLREKIKSLELASPERNSYGHTGMVDRGVNAVSGRSAGRLKSADYKQWYDELPKAFNPVKAVTPHLLQEAPGSLLRQKTQGKDIKNDWRGPASNNEGTMISPRELINYKIPRNTEAVFADKERVIAKLIQNGIPDDLLMAFTQAINEDPEAVPDIMPTLVTMLPDLFSKSKYKVFDNKFLDPNDGARAADTISKNESMDSIARAKAINGINKFNIVPEGIA
jgi:hypothetical protein